MEKIGPCHVCEPNRSGHPLASDEVQLGVDVLADNVTDICSIFNEISSRVQDISFCTHQVNFPSAPGFPPYSRVSIRCRHAAAAGFAEYVRSLDPARLAVRQLRFLADALTDQGAFSPDRVVDETHVIC